MQPSPSTETRRPCDPRALAKSYTGCVYYAVDLPQFGCGLRQLLLHLWRQQLERNGAHLYVGLLLADHRVQGAKQLCRQV